MCYLLPDFSRGAFQLVTMTGLTVSFFFNNIPGERRKSSDDIRSTEEDAEDITLEEDMPLSKKSPKLCFKYQREFLVSYYTNT